VARERTAELSGCTRVAASANSFLASVKAESMEADQHNFFGEPARESVNGLRILAAPGRNLLKKLIIPKKRCRSLTS